MAYMRRKTRNYGSRKKSTRTLRLKPLRTGKKKTTGYKRRRY